MERVSKTSHSVAHDTRGSVTVEYIVLLSLVSVGCAIAMISLGAPLVRMYMVQEMWLSLGVP